MLESKVEHSGLPYFKLREAAFAGLSLLLAAACFGFLFNRESTLSYSIGYNLYGAERILYGEIPYRDFHTLYPPATVYLNALLFKVFGVYLYTALFGVFVFKVLTALVIYLCGRTVMPRIWALTASASTLVWLRPNGPFKPVPMHYGGLFLAAGLLLFLKYLSSTRGHYLVLAGASLGLLALFKHNIGAYAVSGYSLLLFIECHGSESWVRRFVSRLGLLLAGFVAPAIPVAGYMLAERAFGKMLKTLFFGSGEFLVSRLAATPSPVWPILFFAGIAGGFWLAYVLRARVQGLGIIVLLAVGSTCFCVLTGENALSEIVLYLPVLTIGAGLIAALYASRFQLSNRAGLLSVLVAAAASFMETFPRFAREQAIGAMPLVGLLLIYLTFLLVPLSSSVFGRDSLAKLALAVLPVALFVLGSRLFLATYFSREFKPKSDTALTIPRGQGVYFPPAEAREIDAVVDYIQGRVPPGGYVFAQSYAGSSYLFLSDRKNPSGAQFWAGVGVTKAERDSTLQNLAIKQVGLVVTSQRDIDAEKYTPMRECLEQNYRPAAQFGNVIILERKSKGTGFPGA
ncbi:MAG TPA: glycosyltransferase family 39 protein [Blastocatellia bacterium]|nr:glycosyltransferase family 39 protein [Blastocatellia bacterium]